MAQRVLWIQLVGKKHPYKHLVADVDQYLDDLATEICEKKLKNIEPEDLEFFGYHEEAENDESGEPLRSDIQLKHLKTSGVAPLVVRYPLSNVRVHIRYNLSNSKGSVTLPHSTGLYHHLRQEVYKEFVTLRDGDPEFYFVQYLGDGKDGDKVKDEFQLNAIIEDTPAKVKKREISLGIKIEGRKAYGDYTLKEVSMLFLKEEWNNIGNAPTFDIETLPSSSCTPTEEEFASFVNQLSDKNLVFAGKIPNETTAREFISVFMTTAIRIIQKQHLKSRNLQNLQLFVEENLSGTRGYGPVDYLVKYLQLVVMLNEAKHRDFDQGAAQNIVQMHSALEKLNKKRKPDHTGASFAMYGIVTTAKNWIFLRWTGSLEEPIIEISKDYGCGDFTGTMENSKSILSHIIRILLSAMSFMESGSDEDRAVDTEPETVMGSAEIEDSDSEPAAKKGKYGDE